MAQAIALLQAAMALLAMVSGSNSPEMAQITQQATDIAQSAITLATEEIAKIEGQYNLPSQQTKVTVDVPITNPTTKEVTTVKVTQETTVGTGASQEVVKEVEPLKLIHASVSPEKMVIRVNKELDISKTKFLKGIWNIGKSDWDFTEVIPVGVTLTEKTNTSGHLRYELNLSGLLDHATDPTVHGGFYLTYKVEFRDLEGTTVTTKEYQAIK